MKLKSFYRYIFVLLVSLFVLTGCGSDSGGGEFSYVTPVDRGTDGNGNNGGETTISGYVVDEPIKDAKVSLFSIDGTLLDENITTNKEGYFEAKLDNLPNEYIIYSKGGEINGETFDGELFAYCNSNSCNLTPLSTITYQYSNLLVGGTFQERYSKAKSIIMEYTGISSDDIHKISGVGNFKFDKFRTLVKNEGFSSVTLGLVNDLVDDYVDESKYQALFTAIKARLATPISVTVEPIIDKESNSSVSLTVSGIDGSQESKGYMSDIVATTKQTIINDNLEEVTEDVSVYYSFNFGKYKGKLNTETTVLSNLFTSDIDLALLPSESKIKLVELLKKEYKVDYDNTLDDYKKVIEVSKTYTSIYQKSLRKLVSDAKFILPNNFNNIKTLGKKMLLLKVAKNNITKNYNNRFFKKIKYQASKYVNVTYNTNDSTNEYNFKVSNNLPIYFGLKKSLKDYSSLDNLTLPLIQPSKLGLFGMLSSDWKSFNSLLKTTTGIKNAPSTTISGNNWDSDLFKDSVSKPIPIMRRDYTFTKEVGVNLPTIMNVVTGASSVIKIAYGASISTKFEKTMFNLSKKANDVSKGLKYAQDTLDLIVSGSDFFVSFLDTMEKDTSNPDKKFKNLRTDLKIINNYALASQNLLKGITSLIPPKNEDIVKKRGNKFLTTLGTGKDKIKTSHFVSQQILNNAKDKKITYKEAMADIVTGIAFNHILKTIELPKDDKSQYEKGKKEFKKDYISYFEFTNLFVYSFRSKKQAENIYNSYPSVKKSSFENALKKYTKTLVPVILQILDKKKGIPNLYQATLSGAVEKINLFKLLKKSNKSLSDGNALKYSAKLIIEMSKMVKDNAIKNIQGMVKNIVVQIPQYLIGTKYVQLASSANDLIGLGVAWGCTPNSIPIGISVDDNGELIFKEPEIKVLGAVNEIIPLSGQEDVIMTLGNNKNPLIIANKEEPPVYNLAYTLVFGNEFDHLKNFIYDTKEWKDDKAIDVSMWIKKYPNDNLNTEPVFLKNVDYANWTITPKEVVANLEKNTINGKSIPTLNVTNVFAGQKRQSPFPSFSFGKSPFTMQLPSVERGIFVENFDYKIYEFTDSPLKTSSTNVKPLDRIIFKTLNAKELKEKVYLYKYKALNNTLAITNNNDFSIMVYCPSTGEEWEIIDGQTRLFDNEKYKDAEFIISDIVISKYGKIHGYETMAQILGAFEQNLQLTEYITNSKFTAVAQEASSAKKYQFLIKADTSSDFVDKQPALDLAQVVRNDELEDLFYDYIGTKAFLSSYIDSQDYIVGQYSVESYRKDGKTGEESINFKLESGALIPPSIPKDVVDPNVIKNAHESELINNYKLKDIKDYKLDTKVDTYNRVTEFKLTNKLGNSIVFNIDGYQDSEEKTTLYFSIASGIKNLIECTTASCIADDDLEKFNFRLILVSPQKLYPDSDSDNIIDSVDMFPNNGDYQFDSDRDGMPDAWETEYGLNLNDPSDATKDLDHDGENNLQEFTNGTNPKTLTQPTNLTATATTNTITLKWDKVENASSYEICMAEEGIDIITKECTEQNGGKIFNSDSVEKKITDNLVVGTTYYFRVRGVNGNNGIWSDEVNAIAVLAGLDEGAFANPEVNTEHNVKNVGLDITDGTLKLSLDGSNTETTFPFIWVANSGEGTISKLSTITGEELGRYKTGPGNGNPSRTTVDQDGNVWVGNRDNNTITKVGLKEWDQCIDRNENGIIDTSTGKDDVKGWTGSFGDGSGINNAEDECILKHITLEKDGFSADAVRLVAIDPENNVFAGGSNSNALFKVNGTTGEIINAVSSLQNHYGGVIDKNGNLWSMPYPHNGTVQKISNDMGSKENINIGHDGYGITIDKYGKVWTTEYGSRFSTFNPIDPVGTLQVFNQTDHSSAQGIAADSNGDIFIAGSLSGSTVGQYKQLFDENGIFTGVEFVKNYAVQSGPTGVAIDGTGKVWASNYHSNSVSRINPVTEVVEHFSVGSNPYNYSDMTGNIVRTITKRQGTWEATFNGKEDDYPWNKVSWKLKEALPQGTSIHVFAKVDNNEISLNSKDYVEVSNGEVLSSLMGQYLKLKVELSSENLTSTPEVIEIQLY